MSADKSEPAFPIVHPSSEMSPGGPQYFGVTTRDYFAGRALEGMLGGVPGSHLIPTNAARSAYEYADAMLIEREK